MGAVFEAESVRLPRRVAVKVLHPTEALHPQTVRRFLNEARASNIVAHPGIIDVYEFNVTDAGEPYLVMELLRGESLRTRLERRLTLRPVEVVCLAHQIAVTLAAAHARGIVHRDLKPDNVMTVGPEHDERIKILDFGIARLAQEHQLTQDPEKQTRSGAVLGTPLYMAPEQCRGARHADGRADVYALGVMAYELLTGAPPFTAQTIGELMLQHMTATPRPLREVDASLPSDLAALVHAMLAKYPMGRPEAAQVVAALERLACFPEAAAHEPSWARTTPPSTAPNAVPRAPWMKGAEATAEAAFATTEADTAVTLRDEGAAPMARTQAMQGPPPPPFVEPQAQPGTLDAIEQTLRRYPSTFKLLAVLALCGTCGLFSVVALLLRVR